MARFPSLYMWVLVVWSLAACSSSDALPPPPPQPVAGPLAFPGAIGHGAASKGGRGGRVIAVETLADGGPGSLRACIVAAGPRVCVFRVAGVIRFTSGPPIITNPYITIAGQTAPGGGITLAHGGGANGLTPLLIKNSHDVIVRDIRVRPDIMGLHREGQDGITIESSKDVIIDHVSTSWALDENINTFADVDRVTISWSIFAEGIPRHDKCALFGNPVKNKSQHISFIGNICAHNGDRNPDVNQHPGSCIEIANNIFYDAESQFTEIWETFGGTPVAIVGNVYRKGPSTADRAVGIDLVQIGSTGPARIYRYDNRFDGKFQHVSPLVSAVDQNEPDCPLTIAPVSADDAYHTVLQQAGAFPRDPVDQRLVAEVENRTGHIVKQPGVIPPILPGQPYPDVDGDGMDDRWERLHGTDPGTFDAWQDADGDGTANLDQFLDYAHQRHMKGE
ncbi:MAG: pectate lyase [Sphingomonadales bacterium]|nr:pectate lyase [Sphingomonadales bacterium]